MEEEKPPFVSVLVPVYNRATLIGPCVESALAQSFGDLEVIIVDNASTDRTWSVCEELATRDRRVRIFRNETNVGPVRNIAVCLEKARGHLGKLLFSDDLIFPEFLSRSVPFLEDSDTGLVFTATRVGVLDGETRVDYAWSEEPEVVPTERYLIKALLTNTLPVSPGCALFRTADLRKNLTPDIPSPTISDWLDHGGGPDLLFYLLTASQYKQVAHLVEPLSFFRAHPGSITTSDRTGFLTARYQQARIWFAESRGIAGIVPKLLAREWIDTMIRERKFTSPGQSSARYTRSSSLSKSEALRYAGLAIARKLLSVLGRKRV
ncbi:MAG TPA: glycosyltransferase family 2 protein [Thermoanaerobaculia bacterium]|nr:glycosyltransferase family 2 protein [Thermoanaerobaculia bacterium]